MCLCILSIFPFVNRVTDPDVRDDALQMFVILKHGGQAGTIAAGLLLKLVIYDRAVQKKQTKLYHLIKIFIL